MSKLLVLAAVPVVAGLVVWNLSLTSDLSDLRSQLGRSDAPQVKADTPKAAVEPRPRETGRANPQLTELVDRVVLLERTLAEKRAEKRADPGSTEPASAGIDEPSAAAYSSEEFKAAVDRVLDERDLARKREQIEKRAEGMTRIWLHSANVDPDRTKQVVAVVFASLEKQAAIRDDDSISDEQRRAQHAVLEQERKDRIAAILDAQQMEIVGPRLLSRTTLPIPQVQDSTPVNPATKRRMVPMRPGRSLPPEEAKKDE